MRKTWARVFACVCDLSLLLHVRRFTNLCHPTAKKSFERNLRFLLSKSSLSPSTARLYAGRTAARALTSLD